MKKKIKIGLKDMKVNSFVTSLNDSESVEIKGGTEQSCNYGCLTNEFPNCHRTRHASCETYPPFCVPWSEAAVCTGFC